MILSEIRSSKKLYKSLKQDNLYTNIYHRLSRTNLPEGHWYFIHDDNENKGVIGFLIEKDSIVFHGGIYKQYRGTGFKYLNLILKVIKLSSPSCKLLTTINKNNIPAIRLAEKCKLKYRHEKDNIAVYEYIEE
jgi:RimJ/RimL family protein N-acetyltransferase